MLQRLWGGSSLLGYEHLPSSRPGQALESFISVLKSIFAKSSSPGVLVVSLPSIEKAPIVGKESLIIPSSSHAFLDRKTLSTSSAM